MSFPRKAADVTVDWLTDALRAAGMLPPDRHVCDFTLETIGAGFGQTGDAARVRFVYNGVVDAPDTAFIKFATTDPRRRAASRTLDLYRREVDFYRRLRPLTTATAPAAYFADTCDDGEYATLLLQDFPEHRPGDDVAGATPAEAERIVDLLVDLHAPFWGRMGSVALEPLVMGSRSLFTPAWDEMERSFAAYLPDDVRSARDAFLSAVDGLQRWVTSEPTTLGHGDLKLDNILFPSDGAGPIVAVDWQAVRPQRGIRDLAYLLSHSMNVVDRRACEHDLLGRYVAGLERAGVDYPIANAQADYRPAMLFDFLTAVYIVGVNINTHERAIRRKRKLLERTTTAMLDWGALELLPRFAQG